MSRWWYPLAPALPLLLPQAIWVKRRTLRLADASQPVQGVVIPPDAVDCSEPFRLLLIGESTVSGVGVSSHAQALSGQLARQLASLYRCPVAWQAAGRNGARARDCVETLLPVLDGRWDLVLIVLGVNDTTHLTSRTCWRRDVATLVRAFRGRAGQVVLVGVPPMGAFPALPQPLRGWLGLRAGLLDSDLRQLAEAWDVAYVATDMALDADCMAEDGYHPSAKGYHLWASSIATFLATSCLRKAG